MAVCALGLLGSPPTTRGAGQYLKVASPASTATNELIIAVTYTLWIPEGVATIRGIIVHQHGAGMMASQEGSTAAYDLHWQALAKKWDCALLGPCYHVLNDGDLGPAGSEYWFDPRRGSDKAFLRALGDFAAQSGHRELASVPWVLWGHSAGGIWSDVMNTLHPERVVAVFMRSGSTVIFRDRPVEFPRPQVPAAAYGVPTMCVAGVKENIVRKAMLTSFQECRAKGGLIGLAIDPRTHHECGDTRYLAIPYLDACLAMRLPDKWSQDQTLKPMDPSLAWLAPATGGEAAPAEEYKGNVAEAVWLPNEAVAKAWMEYVKTGAVGDATPPPVPFNVQVTPRGEQGTRLTWDAEADFESGLRGFVVLRDGKEFAKVPEKPVGKFGRPLFQAMTYHDTPAQPLPGMDYLDSSAKAGEKHTYAIISVNSVGLKSKPSAEAPLPYLRLNSAVSYAVDPAWPERRKELVWGGMSGVAVDGQDNVWVLSRTNPFVQVYQADGKFLRSWGDDLFSSPHKLVLDRQGNVWVTDTRQHVVMQCSPQGKLLRTLGTRGEPGCDERHFDKPTDMVVTPAGEVFISDGYGNARVVHYDREGKFVKSWGKLGIGPGEFNLPHAIAVDSQGRLYVADRNNARIQVFTRDATFLDEWRNLVVPCAFWMTKEDELWVCGSSPMTWRPEDNTLGYPPKDQLFMKFNPAGKLLQLWSVPKGEDGKERPGDLNWVHGLAVDSKGNIYAVDVMGRRVQKFVPSPGGGKPAGAS
jgi:sugar lactone lactonase YvrE